MRTKTLSSNYPNLYSSLPGHWLPNAVRLLKSYGYPTPDQLNKIFKIYQISVLRPPFSLSNSNFAPRTGSSEIRYPFYPRDRVGTETAPMRPWGYYCRIQVRRALTDYKCPANPRCGCFIAESMEEISCRKSLCKHLPNEL